MWAGNAVVRGRSCVADHGGRCPPYLTGPPPVFRAGLRGGNMINRGDAVARGSAGRRAISPAWKESSQNRDVARRIGVGGKCRGARKIMRRGSWWAMPTLLDFSQARAAQRFIRSAISSLFPAHKHRRRGVRWRGYRALKIRRGWGALHRPRGRELPGRR